MAENKGRQAGRDAHELQELELSRLSRQEIVDGQESYIVRSVSARTVLPYIANARRHRRVDTTTGEVVACGCKVCREGVLAMVSVDEVTVRRDVVVPSPGDDGEQSAPSSLDYWDDTA